MDMPEYRVGRFTLKPRRELLHDGAPVAIGRKAIELLSVLAEAQGALVTKDELMAAVWRKVIVEDNAIQVHVAALRKALGGDAQQLSTVHGLGYRLAVTN
jgi:DNA-binding winged helix-turn-helix (wHTH) protein